MGASDPEGAGSLIAARLPFRRDAGHDLLLFRSAVVFVVAILLRLPFTSRVLFAWDSVLYARAIEYFRVALAPLESRPHPPGYLFYVLAGRAGATLTGEVNSGLVLVSIVAGALTCAAGYAMAVRLAGPRVAAVTAALLVASPLLWEYSEVAYPYTVLALLAGAVGFALWEARRSGMLARVAASAAFGLASGFRQDLFVILGPLWLFAASKGGPRALAASTAAVAVASLAWLIPSGLASGGIDTYLQLSIAEAAGSGIGEGTTQYGRDLALTLIGIAAQLLLATPLLFVGAWAMVRGRHRELAPLLLLWTVPAVVLYVGIHIGSWPYTLSIAVPLSIVAGLGSEAMVVAAGRVARAAIAMGIGATVVTGGAYFLLADGQFTAHEIRVRDRSTAERVATIRERYRPTETVILAVPGYMLAVRYLPEYAAVLVPASGGAGVTALDIPTTATVAVLFDAELGLDSLVPAVRVALSDGDLRVVSVPPDRRLAVVNGALSFAPR